MEINGVKLLSIECRAISEYTTDKYGIVITFENTNVCEASVWVFFSKHTKRNESGAAIRVDEKSKINTIPAKEKFAMYFELGVKSPFNENDIRLQDIFIEKIQVSVGGKQLVEEMKLLAYSKDQLEKVSNINKQRRTWAAFWFVGSFFSFSLFINEDAPFIAKLIFGLIFIYTIYRGVKLFKKRYFKYQFGS